MTSSDPFAPPAEHEAPPGKPNEVRVYDRSTVIAMSLFCSGGPAAIVQALSWWKVGNPLRAAGSFALGLTTYALVLIVTVAADRGSATPAANALVLGSGAVLYLSWPVWLYFDHRLLRRRHPNARANASGIEAFVFGLASWWLLQIILDQLWPLLPR